MECPDCNKELYVKAKLKQLTGDEEFIEMEPCIFDGYGLGAECPRCGKQILLDNEE